MAWYWCPSSPICVVAALRLAAMDVKLESMSSFHSPSLHWADVDLENRRLYLHETKNGSLRVLPLNDLASQLFETLPKLGPTEPVLVDVDPARLSVYTRRLFKSLGIMNASFHSFRHTAASWLVMGGVDLYVVGRLLGHRTPRMTQRYAHSSALYLAGAIGKLDAAFGDVMQDRVPSEAA